MAVTRSENMSDEGKLFVGGLSFDTDDTSLKESFRKHGNVVKADVVRDRETGRSRGFGFVTFENPQDAKDAMADMDGQVVDGKQIRVDEAGKPSGRSGGGSFRGSGPRGGFFRGGRRGDGGGYGHRSYERNYGDRSYPGRNYGREGGFGGNRNYGDEDRSYGGYRSSGSGGSGGSGGGGGGGYNAGYSRENRSQNSYGGEQRPAPSYRDSYDAYS